MKLWLAALVLLVATSCGNDTQSHGDHLGSEDHAPITFGEAADPEAADRTVAVSAVDSLKFDPPTIDVQAGETVTFVVTNDGETDHEFVIGDDIYQDWHAAQMSEMDHNEGNGVFLEPGDTGEVTWTFADAGELIYACHVNGHFDSGMYGSIQVR